MMIDRYRRLHLKRVYTKQQYNLCTMWKPTNLQQRTLQEKFEWYSERTLISCSFNQSNTIQQNYSNHHRILPQAWSAGGRVKVVEPSEYLTGNKCLLPRCSNIVRRKHSRTVSLNDCAKWWHTRWWTWYTFVEEVLIKFSWKHGGQVFETS
jgi:hypothetical protein